MRTGKVPLLVCAVSLVAACGGGGGSTPAPSPPPTGGGGGGGGGAPPAAPLFTDATTSTGISYEHGYRVPTGTDEEWFSGGAAAGDYDGDGDIDLFVVRGDIGANYLYRNDGNAVFTDVAVSAGLAYTLSASENYRLSGPTFADMDGDGDLDLFVGGFEGSPSFIFQNNGDGTFSDVSVASGIRSMQAVNTNSAAFGDYDRDGDIDMFLSHWGTPRLVANPGDTEHLWRNISTGGNIQFESVSVSSRISSTIIRNKAGVLGSDHDYTFSPTFVDIDDDGYPDVLSVGDFVTTRVFLNNRDGTFTDVTDESVIIDDSGMGSAVGDYDNDGDMDWFVSSIKSTVTGSVIGNRLYRNDNGVFVDVTDTAGVSDGSWGWAACFFDADNDGDLDIFHVNGWRDSNTMTNFETDFSPLFVSDGAGTFDNKADEANIVDQEQGRGLVCADFDNDGDVDLFITHRDLSNSATYYRNDSAAKNYLGVKLVGKTKNTEAAGARIRATSGSLVQHREIVIGSNFTSQNPTLQLFGLNDFSQVDELVITWPDGTIETHLNIAANQTVSYTQP